MDLPMMDVSGVIGETRQWEKYVIIRDTKVSDVQRVDTLLSLQQRNEGAHSTRAQRLTFAVMTPIIEW